MKRFENKVEMLVDKLLKEYDKADPNYLAAEEFIPQIKELIIDCYDYAGLCEWLAEHDFDILFEFRNADFRERCDYNSDEEWEEARDDALLVSEDGSIICYSW